MMVRAAPWLRRVPGGPWLVLAAGGAVLVVVLSLGSAGGATSLSVWLLWVLLVPLLEEAVFRVGLQDALLRQGLRPWLAISCTALCFMASHVLLRGAGWTSWAVVVPALLLGLVYDRSRQLRACVALHALMNAGWLAAQQMAPQ